MDKDENGNDKVVPINRKEREERDEKLEAENAAWSTFADALKETIHKIIEEQEKEKKKTKFAIVKQKKELTDEEIIIDKIEKETIGRGIEDDE